MFGSLFNNIYVLRHSSGGGTIGTGMAPSPQEQGFSGNNGQGNNQQTEGASQPPQGMGQLQ